MQASTDCPAVNAGQPSLLDHHCHGILALICVHWLPNMLLELYSSGAHLHITISCNKLYKLCIDRLQVQAMRGRSRSPFGIHLFLLEALLLPRKQLAIARTPDCTSSPRFGRLGRGAYREAALLGIWQKLCKTQHVLLSMAKAWMQTSPIMPTTCYAMHESTYLRIWSATFLQCCQHHLW